MYEVQITMTGKSYRAGDEYIIFDTDKSHYTTIEAVKLYLDNQYGKCKRVRMYQDVPGKEPVQSGWIYCFNNADMCHVPVQKWRQQDWVKVVELDPKTVDPKLYS